MKKDILERKYFRDNKRFASIFNYVLHDGKPVIEEDKLVELDTNLISTNPILTNRERDVFKKAVIKTDGKQSYLLLGIENQTRVDKNMVFRNMLYDALSYIQQTQNIENNNKNGKIKVNRINPVITLVIYYSHKKWNGKRDLYSMLEIKDENLKKYISNYKLNLIEPYSMTEEDLSKLDRDLRILLGMIKNSGDVEKLEKYVLNNEIFKHVGIDTAVLLNEIINAGLKIEEGDEINMCKAIEDLKAQGRAEGRAEGRNEGIAEGRVQGRNEGKAEATRTYIKTMKNNGATEEMIAKLLSLDINYVKKVLA